MRPVRPSPALQCTAMTLLRAASALEAESQPWAWCRSRRMGEGGHAAVLKGKRLGLWVQVQVQRRKRG